METCVTFDLSKELVYDANTGTCTLGADGIDLKRPQENSCRVPTAQLSVKMAFGAGDSNTVHIDFSSNGGSTFYTEEEGGQTRLAVPASLFERNLQTAGTCQDCGETIFNVGYKQGIRAPWSGQSARQDTWHYNSVYYDLYYPTTAVSGDPAVAGILAVGDVYVPFAPTLPAYNYNLLGALAGPNDESEIPSQLADTHGCNPLFVYSHGNGGFPAENNRLSVELAKYGFIVAAPYHGGIPLALADRPNEVVSVYNSLRDTYSICSNKVVVGGHAFGAFTAMAVAY